MAGVSTSLERLDERSSEAPFVAEDKPGSWLLDSYVCARLWLFFPARRYRHPA